MIGQWVGGGGRVFIACALPQGGGGFVILLFHRGLPRQISVGKFVPCHICCLAATGDDAFVSFAHLLSLFFLSESSIFFATLSQDHLSLFFMIVAHFVGWILFVTV
jgi:hypothetical protein